MELTPGAIDRVVERVAAELRAAAEEEAAAVPADAPPSPFAISWMDSYLAHWELRRDMQLPEGGADRVRELLRELVDVRFDDRIAEIRDVIAGQLVPPDGGPPEPGTPPVGPATILAVDPDPGPPPPDGGPPEPGVPPVGPTGPAVIFDPAENPWILYWFVSVKAPLLLDMIDAHLVRRLDELRGGQA